jgi:hypothetical protein
MFRNAAVVALLALLLLLPEFSQAQNLQRSGFIAVPRRPIPAPPGDGWVWVPPVYRTVYGRIWREPVYQTVTENVWISDQYVWRTICTWENGQPVERQAWVLIPAHQETRTRQILVTPGGWTWGSHQELVTPGHWERIGVGPVPPPQPQPPHTPAPRPPGLEPFSPLWEWPS